MPRSGCGVAAWFWVPVRVHQSSQLVVWDFPPARNGGGEIGRSKWDEESTMTESPVGRWRSGRERCQGLAGAEGFVPRERCIPFGLASGLLCCSWRPPRGGACWREQRPHPARWACGCWRSPRCGVCRRLRAHNSELQWGAVLARTAGFVRVSLGPRGPGMRPVQRIPSRTWWV